MAVEDLLLVKGFTEEQVTIWLNYYNYHLEGTPKELLQTEEGKTKVTEYLNFMVNK